MSNRIIDLTLSSEIVGTESIPGTEQVAIEETTPKNKRYTWNMVLTWFKSKISNRISKDLIVTNSTVYDTQSFAAGTSIIGIILCENSPEEGNFMGVPVSVKIGTRAGLDDILPLTECPLGISEGTRISISYFKNSDFTLYITMTAYPTEPEYLLKVAIIFETNFLNT